MDSDVRAWPTTRQNNRNRAQLPARIKVVQFDALDREFSIFIRRSTARQSYLFNHGFELVQVDSVVPR